MHFSTLGAYTVISTIGKGENGEVFKVKLSNSCVVALKRFDCPEVALDSIVRLLHRAPLALDLPVVVKTRAAFDSNGIFVLVQELCGKPDYTSSSVRESLIKAMFALPEILLKNKVAHSDIKPDNMVAGQDGRYLLCDVDSMMYISADGSPRVSIDDGFGSFTQFLTPLPRRPKNQEDACNISTCRDADFHMAYPAVQTAFMLFSCLISAIYIDAEGTDGGNDVLWACLLKNGCVLDMDLLASHCKCYPITFAKFCDAWVVALDLILAEEGAAAIFAMPQTRKALKRKR